MIRSFLADMSSRRPFLTWICARTRSRSTSCTCFMPWMNASWFARTSSASLATITSFATSTALISVRRNASSSSRSGGRASCRVPISCKPRAPQQLCVDLAPYQHVRNCVEALGEEARVQRREQIVAELGDEHRERVLLHSAIVRLSPPPPPSLIVHEPCAETAAATARELLPRVLHYRRSQQQQQEAASRGPT